jgi:hypothetical protein
MILLNRSEVPDISGLAYAFNINLILIIKFKSGVCSGSLRPVFLYFPQMIISSAQNAPRKILFPSEKQG